MLCSLDVNISVVCTTASIGQRDRNDANFRKRAVSFAACTVVGSRLEIFATLPRAMDRSNAKFGEGAKPLFYNVG